MMDKKTIICEICDYKCSYKCLYKRHCVSQKHYINVLERSRIAQEKEENTNTKMKYFCITCDYTCGNKYNYNKHLATQKHIKAQIKAESDTKTPAEPVAIACEVSENSELKDPVVGEQSDSYMNIINKLFSENQELRNFVIEQSKEHTKDTKDLVNKVLEISSTKNTVVTNTLNGNINHINRFNINLFLNDKCKDALNLSDFIDSMEITNEDLENNASLGFVGGISKILLDNLKNLSIYERPIHCTDVKRETIYIKDEDKWEKEDDMTKMRNAIQEISRKSLIQLCKWREENPEYNNLDSEMGMKCLMINQASMAGANREQYYGKVIKTLIKETIIDKNQLS